jgi:hypothetical protein
LKLGPCALLVFDLSGPAIMMAVRKMAKASAHLFLLGNDLLIESVTDFIFPP